MTTWDDILNMSRRAREALEKLTPEERAAHYREQRIDWAWGQIRSRNPDVTREQVEQIAAEMDRRG